MPFVTEGVAGVLIQETSEKMSTAIIVVGLGYGDEGKGSLIDFLTQKHSAKLVVRFNGGAQAGHNVVLDDGREHKFSQFGSGTFHGARTFLSRYMLFNPITLLSEAKHLTEVGVKDPLSLLTVEKTAKVTTPFHMAANRVRELLRGPHVHGSCGMGIGETMRHSIAHPEDTLLVQDMADHYAAVRKLERIRDYFIRELSPSVLKFQHAGGEFSEQLRTELEILIHDPLIVGQVAAKFVEVYRKLNVVGREYLNAHLAVKDQTVVFEGAQGVLLDQDYGFHPHTTWSDCTFGNALKLIESFNLDTMPYTNSNTWGARPTVSPCEVTKIGVLRGYMTRHGAGPFVTEDKGLTMPKSEHNAMGAWQQGFRLGHFDPIATRYALEVIGGVDQLALTCLDHLPFASSGFRTCKSYTSAGAEERARPARMVGLDSDYKWDRIPVNPIEPNEKHLAYQQATTDVLNFLKPVYDHLPDVDSFIAHVEQTLKTPVKIASFGPKASDKSER
jgi:adenylosuccinate synthase